MNKNFIFIKNNNDTFLYYLSFIPLLIYGLYKNGYLLVNNNYTNSFDAYKIIMYPIGCIIIGLLFSLVFKKRKRYIVSFATLMGMAAPYNFNMFLYYGIVFAFLFISYIVPNKYKINEASFLLTLLIILNYFSKQFSMFNPMELSKEYSYSLVDLFFGRGASFLFTSSIVYLILAFFILSFIKTYKKDIPLQTSTFFFAFVLIYMIVTKTYLNNIKLLFNGTTIFSFVYLATINEASPSTKKITYIYSFLIALLSFVLIYIYDIYTGGVLSVFIISVLYRIYEMIRQKVFLKNLC